MADKSLLSVDEALDRILLSATPLAETEAAPLAQALDRTLAADIIAKRTQPPCDVSAMDGYAVRAADFHAPGARVKRVGESAAGHGFEGSLGPGECVRIFTGAPTPPGADAILLQEDAFVEGETVGASRPPGPHIRPRGLDFTEGQLALKKGVRLGPAEIALAAVTNHATVHVVRRPRVALIASGDELVAPGGELKPGQIVSCNNLIAASLIARAGGEAIDLGIFRDDIADLTRGLDLAQQQKADVIVTLGGASVGDRDLLRPALKERGMTLDFWRIAMRPGKPLIFGKLGETLVLGLPGNPVAAFVCGLVFLQPLLRKMLGDPHAGVDRTEGAILGADLPANKARRDYLRASLRQDANGWLVATALPRQDSSLLTELVEAPAVIVREVGAGPGKAGDPCRILRIK